MRGLLTGIDGNSQGGNAFGIPAKFDRQAVVQHDSKFSRSSGLTIVM